ncbi:serpin family protein [Methanococcoides sp. AM1]|uniref:serpin family protein n=1 Tax=Methanococcoides sp. AM1 TaxID=1201011 RepID=UPI0010848B78|nr:serpin family protein [Methanococcoides sp. AM1]
MTSKQTALAILLLAFALTCIGCIENTQADPDTTINAQSVEEYDLAAANNAFAFDLYSELQEGKDGNMLISPYSIFTAMAICYEGAEGTTQQQMAEVLYYPLDRSVMRLSAKEYIDTVNRNSDDYELKTANAIWLREDQQLVADYENNIEEYYNGNVDKLDFEGEPEESAKTINEWVEEQTNNKIKDIIDGQSFDGYTKLVVTNAIYFNGRWQEDFVEFRTNKEPFHLTEGEEIQVDMMYDQRKASYGETPEAKILELPYKGNDLSMYVVLPNENNIDNFESTFTVNNYDKLKRGMSDEYDVRIWLPKFKFQTKEKLSYPLVKMGLTDAFYDFGFTGITEETDLTISEVIHQTYIDVQEKGTEAAAATAVEAVDCAIVDEPVIKEFKADHPFMFFIEDKRTGCILFMGKVEHPEYDQVATA